MIDYEAVFKEHRPFLWGYCYRLTGCAEDAEDTVQETFIRAMERPPADLARPWRPWLVRVASNLVKDDWRSARSRYVGSWLPSPIDTELSASAAAKAPWSAGLDADHPGRYETLESVSFAFLLALEALTPRQRAVLLLRDVYDYSGRDCALALGLSVANVKTTLHRARRALTGYDRQRQAPTAALAQRHRKALEKLLGCFASREAKAMERLLAEEVRAISDAGGLYHAARVPVVGREKVALFFSKIAPDASEEVDWQMREVNGLPALFIQRPDAGPGLAPRWVFRLELDSRGLIKETHAILAPRKLSAV